MLRNTVLHEEDCFKYYGSVVYKQSKIEREILERSMQGRTMNGDLNSLLKGT